MFSRFAIAFVAIFVALPALAQVRVDGYFRQDGTYVAPYYRSAPDNTPLNNYSTKGNVNPFTGKPGTVNPYPETPPRAQVIRPYDPFALPPRR